MNKYKIIIIVSIFAGFFSGIYWLSLPYEKTTWQYHYAVGDIWTTEINYRSQRFIKVKRRIVDLILITETYPTYPEDWYEVEPTVADDNDSTWSIKINRKIPMFEQDGDWIQFSAKDEI